MDDANVQSRVSIAVVSVDQLASAEEREIEALCTRAFEQDFAGLFDLVRGGDEPLHVVARAEGRIVGHACWGTRPMWVGDGEPLRAAYVDAVAAEPALQGRGIGSTIIARLVEEIRSRDYHLGGLSTSRVSFYERLGWERWRGPTAVRLPGGLVPTPDAVVLILRTPRTPLLDREHTLSVEPRGGEPW